MTEPIFNYDEASDTLYVSFEPGAAATGVALNDHMLLRLNTHEHRAIGITFFEYSVLAQATETGPRSFPLTGLAQCSEELRAVVLDILRRPPVCDLLSLATYTPSLSESLPIASLRPVPITATEA